MLYPVHAAACKSDRRARADEIDDDGGPRLPCRIVAAREDEDDRLRDEREREKREDSGREARIVPGESARA